MGYPLGFFFAAEYEGFEGRQGQNAFLCRRSAGSTADLTALGLGCQSCAAPKRQLLLNNFSSIFLLVWLRILTGVDGRARCSQNSAVRCFALRNEQTHMSAFAVTENSVVLTLFEKVASINSAKGATPVTAYYAL